MSATPYDDRRHGPQTHEQQQRIINKQEVTKAADIEPVNETIEEARKKHPQPEIAYDMESGERAIDHGVGHDSAHRKHRS